MKNLQNIVKSVVLTSVITACGSVESRYTDNEFLERPPIVGASHQDTEQALLARDEKSKKAEKGLGEDVSISKDSPVQINLKRSFDEAWHDLELTLKQLEIEVTDRERDKGVYYVNYDADEYKAEDSNFLDKSASFFKNDYKQSVYVVTVEEVAGEARITANLAKEIEQTTHGLSTDKENNTTDLTFGSDKLLLSLYQELRNKLVED